MRFRKKEKRGLPFWSRYGDKVEPILVIITIFLLGLAIYYYVQYQPANQNNKPFPTIKRRDW